jgi:hypothetical protein
MKGVIIEVDLYAGIRTLYTESESQRSIAKRLGISGRPLRNTVKAAPILIHGNLIPALRTSSQMT